MRNKGVVVILYFILGIFLSSNCFLSFHVDHSKFDTEQTDDTSNEKEEPETKRSFDDEVFLVNTVNHPFISFRISKVTPTQTEELPHVSLSLHYPPPNVV